MPHIQQEIEQNNRGLTAEELAAAAAFLAILTRGRFTTSAVTKRALINQLAFLTSMRTRDLGLALIEGNLSIAQFTTGRVELIESGNIAGAMVWAESSTLTFSQQSVLVGRVNDQLRFLANFEDQLIAGTNKVNSAARAQQYGRSLRGTFYASASGDAEELGFDLERNILHPGDTCDTGTSCLGETNRGDVPIGSLVEIGSRTCRGNCNCTITYVNSVTGETLVS